MIELQRSLSHRALASDGSNAHQSIRQGASRMLGNAISSPQAHRKEGVEKFLQPRRCDQDTAPHSYRVRICERWRSTIDNSDTRIIPAPEPKDERFRGITR